MLLGMRSPKVGPTPVVSWVSTTDPSFPSSSLTYSGPSLATMFDSTGKLTYAPNNLLTQSNTFSNAAWTKQNVTLTNANAVSDPVGGTDATTVTATAGGGAAQLYFTFSATTAPNVIQAIWIKRRTGSGAITLVINGSSKSLAVNGSWQFLSGSGAPGTGPYFFQLTFATSGDAVDIYAASNSAVTYETTPRAADQVITTSSAYYGPRIDYDPNTLAVKGLLIEEARTNLFIQSGGLSATATFSAVKSTDGTLAPDGVTEMTKITAAAATAAHELYNAAPITVVSGTTYSASIFVKKGNHRYVFITYEVSAGANGIIAIFDLDNPSAATQTFSTGGGSLVTHGILNEGGGVYRIYVVGSVAGAGTSGYMVAGFAAAATGNPTTTTEPSFTASGTENGYFFGAQFEAGSFATSYIPTAASSVTRAADVVQFTGAALTALQGSAGSAVVEHTSELTTQPGTLRLIGTTSSRALIYGLSDTSAASWNGSVSLNATIGSSGKFSTTARTAAAWSASGRSIVANGGTVATDANAAFGGVSPAGAWLGSDGGTANWGSGWYKSFALYNQRLPDATLQARSVVGASY